MTQYIHTDNISNSSRYEFVYVRSGFPPLFVSLGPEAYPSEIHVSNIYNVLFSGPFAHSPFG